MYLKILVLFSIASFPFCENIFKKTDLINILSILPQLLTKSVIHLFIIHYRKFSVFVNVTFSFVNPHDKFVIYSNIQLNNDAAVYTQNLTRDKVSFFARQKADGVSNILYRTDHAERCFLF